MRIASAEDSNSPAVAAQARLHHQYLLGLELMIATREGPEVVGDWMFRLFRRQHEEKFLSSFRKLGLDGEPHAVACAKYHVLSNRMGGVDVEYMEESATKAWVRFRYPRWMYDGPAICGVPIEASRGFLRGWYAQNGVSLNNPRLGFVCVSEDMSGEFGLCGYFREHDHDLGEDERLVFAPHERPPAVDPKRQPALPSDEWSEARLAKANRNYAVEFIRNGVRELVPVIGEAKTLEHGKLAARLTGLQHWRHMAGAVGGRGWRTEGSGRVPARHVCKEWATRPRWKTPGGASLPCVTPDFESCAVSPAPNATSCLPAGSSSGEERSIHIASSWRLTPKSTGTPSSGAFVSPEEPGDGDIAMTESIVIYHNPRCSRSRAALALLRD